jgi:hypothetical protein
LLLFLRNLRAAPLVPLADPVLAADRPDFQPLIGRPA